MNRLHGTRVLVWGARGFIGHALVSELLRTGARVRVLARTTSAPLPDWVASVDWVTLGAAGRNATFDQALDGAGVVFNLAGASGAVASNDAPRESLEANCGVQLEFLEACARAAHTPHVVFASSRLVYAQAGREPVTEDHPVGPLSMYGAHKLCVEHYHRIFAARGAISFTICRISNPFGVDLRAEGKGYGFINTLIHRALTGAPLTIFGLGQQLRDYLYIDDLVAALRLCAEHARARNETFNVGLGTSVRMCDAAMQVREHLGGGPVQFVPWPAAYAAVESGDFVSGIERIRTRLGFTPSFTFAAGLAHVRARALAGVSTAS